MKREVIEYTCDICQCEVDKSIIIPKVLELDRSYTIKLDTDNDICVYCFIKEAKKLDPRTLEVTNAR